jgi:ubiquinone biosynthesis protein UbiJ
LSNPLETFALGRLQSALNGALALDPASTQALTNLGGKTLVVQCSFPPRTLAVTFSGDGTLALSDQAPAAPTVSLSGNPVALALLLAKASEQVTFADSGVSVRGDQDMLRALGAIMAQLDIDWEQALAGVIGDTPAHLAGKAVREALKWHKTLFERSTSGVADFVREESGFTLSRTEAEPWLRGVRHLAADTDRLAARINRLRVRLER